MANQKNILIVEDEALIAMAVVDDIADMGNPIPVATEADALDALAHNDIHFALVDYHLQHGTSASIIAALSGRGVPFAICTGSAPELEDGALDGLSRLPKPYLTGELRRIVSAALGASLCPA